MEQHNEATPSKRPVFLSILCILSWIWQLIAAVWYVMVLMGGGSGLYCVLAFTAVIISFFGVLQMWRLRKMGFFLYVGAFALTIINDSFVLEEINTWTTTVAVVFIAMYAIHLKQLKN